MTFSPSTARKLTIDEESFQHLLAAAYTLQENKDVFKAENSEQDSASVISEIAGLRSQILAHLDEAGSKLIKTAPEAAALVADSLRRLTQADGATVCLIVDGYLRPTACSGTAAKVSGGSVASNSLVATERLRNGRAFQSANACSDIRMGPSLCLELQIGSLLAFPIQRQNEIAGLIEIRWAKADAFGDGDERICQLMADLMGEVLQTEDDRGKSQATDSVPVTAPRRGVAEMAPPSTKPETQDRELRSAPGVTDAKLSSDSGCRVCGKPLDDDQNFCGICGMLSASPDNGMQGKWASMWFMQQAQNAVETREDQGERLWPIHAGGAQNADEQGAAAITQRASDDLETDETLSERKRGPRGVLAVLKSRFRVRAMGQ